MERRTKIRKGLKPRAKKAIIGGKPKWVVGHTRQTVGRHLMVVWADTLDEAVALYYASWRQVQKEKSEALYREDFPDNSF